MVTSSIPKRSHNLDIRSTVTLTQSNCAAERLILLQHVSDLINLGFELFNEFAVHDNHYEKFTVSGSCRRRNFLTDHRGIVSVRVLEHDFLFSVLYLVKTWSDSSRCQTHE